MASNPKIFDGGLSTETPCFVGVDQSLTGFAVSLTDELGLHYMTQVYKAPDTGVLRLINIYNFLGTLLKEYQILDVAMEAPVRMSHSAIISGELYAVVRLFFYENYTIAPTQVPPTSLKKYVAGKGTGVQKNQMLLQVYKKWGIEFTDDNAADSYGLARIAAGLADDKVEKEVLGKLKDPKFRDVV